jgi:PAS domain S-box-containing protein
MTDFFARLLDTSGFSARWYCGDWTAGHGWLHILSDLSVWSAYFVIPLVLGYFVVRRRDLPFRSIFVLFVAFILLCGTTHLMEAIIFWWPAYRLAGVIKLLTAVVSWSTVFALVQVAPHALAMRSPEELEREIAARKQAEEALQRANADLGRRVGERTAELAQAVEQLQIVTDSMSVPVTRCGRDLKYLWVSKPYADWIGRPVQEIKSRPISTVIGEEAFERLRFHFEEVLSGRVVRYEEQIPFRGIGPRWVSVVYTPTLGADGVPDGWVAVVNDLTERKRAEEALRQSEERFARFMQHLPGLAWIKDSQGRYAYANDDAVRAFGVPRESLYGRADEGVFPPATAAEFRGHDRRALESRAGVQVIETLEHPDGTVHHSLVSKFPIPIPEGGEVLVGGIAIDITDRLEMEAALKEADRRKDAFLATLAHELRNPLAPIRHAVEVLKAKGTPDPDLSWCREVIERQVGQMARLLDDLLDVSRITRNKLELRKERVALATVLDSAVETSRPVIDGGGHELTVSLPSEPVYLDADPVRLAQVFANLLNNAAKYTDRGGRIRLAAERVGQEVVVSVRDDGIGIAADVLPRLFEMFSQVAPALERSQGGLGIGLSLVKGLVEMHDGTVEARSTGPGRGSEFVVRLPVAAGPVIPELPPADIEWLSPAGRRIVVADDSRDAADSLAMMLRLMGHEVRTVGDGQEAVEVVQGYRPDVAILDIGMPRLNGYEAARRIREQPWGRDVLLVALTGWGQDADRRQAERAGFDSHFTKPVEAALLQELLAELQSKKG